MNDLNKDTPKHKRRIRYKGRHPRQFKEKYKELNSEKYPEDIEKVLLSGKTPAGTHRPIFVQEILEVLNPLPGEVGLDATLGFGGHALELLKKITPHGRLFALDVDPIEIVRTEKRLRAMGYGEKELVIKRSNFAGMAKLLAEADKGFDFILADLGISSMQLDNPERGFTFKHKGPLDLRLNPQRGQTARELIRTLDQQQLEYLFKENSDEPCSKLIAAAIFKQRNQINTTTDLADVIMSAFDQQVQLESKHAIKNSIQRVFQALRIAVNDEFFVLEQFLRNLPFCLKPQGRAAILSFHPGEDKRIADFFEQGLKTNIYSKISLVPIRPSAKEQAANPRSKSARLRWAIKA